MFIDPSVKETKKADYKAMITVGLDKSTMNYYVIDSWIKKASIENMLKATFRLYEKYHHNLIGFESNGFQILLKPLYEELEKEYQISLPFKTVEHYHQSKNIRIAPLSPLMERGKLFFRKCGVIGASPQFGEWSVESGVSRGGTSTPHSTLQTPHSGSNAPLDDTKILIEQLLYYPQANVNDDGPDALAGAVNLANSFVSKNNVISVGAGKRESSKLLKNYKY